MHFQKNSVASAVSKGKKVKEQKLNPSLTAKTLPLQHNESRDQRSDNRACSRSDKRRAECRSRYDATTRPATHGIYAPNCTNPRTTAKRYLPDRWTGNRYCDRRGWLRGRLHRHLWCRRSLFFNSRYRWTWSHGYDRRGLRRWRRGLSDSNVNESTDRQDRRNRQKSDYLLRRTLPSSSA
jgi:hypothetical protein